MGGAPTGTVTFLFTDIEGSTRLWEAASEVMPGCLARHDELLRSVFDRHGGQVFATGGDGFAVAFGRAADAIDAACEALQALEGEQWPPGAEIRVRMGIHTGEATERDGDYFGGAVNRTARLMALAHGGQALCSGTTLGVVEDPPPTLDLGEHRLRDLLTPVRVHQLGTRSFPPLRSSALVPSNLPEPATELIGRAGDVTAVADEAGRHRLVTISGVGGMGKTRLAIEVAASLAADFPDGVWFVDLAPVVDGGDVVRAVAASMGATAASSSAEALVTHLEDRLSLLVLDNCEHVIDAVADLATSVLARASRVTMLATSREPLDVAGEYVRHLRPLGLPDAEAFGVAAGEYPAVRLFEERAQAARAGFVMGDDNVEDVAEICRRLDGVPLAIELAAARVGAMSVGDIRARLGERFRLLAGSRRGHERHRTLQAAVDWSYDLLDPEDRRVFRSLSVFAGGFGLVDATAVVGGPDGDEFEVLDQVTRLVDRSLVVHDGETGRYRLLETLRQFGGDRLVETGEADEVLDRFASYYSDLAHREGRRVFGADYGEAKAIISDAFDCLRATAEWLGATGRWRELTALVKSLWLFLNQEVPADQVAWLRPVLDTEAEVDPQVRYDASWVAATGAMVAGDVVEAVGLDGRARAIFEQHPGLLESPWANYVPVTMAVYVPDSVSLATCEVALDCAERCGDPYAAIHARSLALLLGPSDGPGVDAAIERCMADANELGGPVWLGTAVYFATAALLRDGTSESKVRRVLELAERFPGWREGGSLVKTSTMLNLALARTASDPAAAVAEVGDYVRITDRTGIDHWMTGAPMVAAYAAARLGSNDLAARMYRHRRSADSYEFVGHAWVLRDTVAMLGEAGYGEDALTPQAMTRPEIFATLAELQHRHPVSSG